MFDFGFQCGEFRCILGGIFVAVQLPVLHTKSYNLVPFPIFLFYFLLQIGFLFPVSPTLACAEAVMLFVENFVPWPMVEIRPEKSRGLSSECILGAYVPRCCC